MFCADLEVKLSPPGSSTSMSTSGATENTNTSNPNQSYEVTPAPTDTVSSLSFSPKADYLVATSWDNQVRCYEVSRDGASIASQLKTTFLHDYPLCSAWSDDGTTVFTGGGDKQAKMWKLLSGAQPTTVATHEKPIKDIAWIPEKKLLVTGSWDMTLKYWDIRQEDPVHRQQLPGKCHALTVKDNLMVVGTGKTLVVFDLHNHQIIDSSLQKQTSCLAAFPDKKGFLVGSIEGEVGIHHLDDAEKNKDYTFECHREGDTFYSVNSLNFHPIHGTFASAGSDGTFCFWDKNNGTRLKVSSKCDQPITSSTFNRDGSLFAYAVGYDGNKDAEDHNPDVDKTSIFLHQTTDEDVKPRPVP